jgi:hypothetical protein
MEVPYAVQMENIRRQEQYARDNPAEKVFQTINQQIKEFKARLEEGEKLALRLNNVAGEQISLSDVSFVSPSFIVFEGETADGDFAKVYQSVSQLNFTLLAVKGEIEKQQSTEKD